MNSQQNENTPMDLLPQEENKTQEVQSTEPMNSEPLNIVNPVVNALSENGNVSENLESNSERKKRLHPRPETEEEESPSKKRFFSSSVKKDKEGEDNKALEKEEDSSCAAREEDKKEEEVIQKIEPSPQVTITDEINGKGEPVNMLLEEELNVESKKEEGMVLVVETKDIVEEDPLPFNNGMKQENEASGEENAPKEAETKEEEKTTEMQSKMLGDSGYNKENINPKERKNKSRDKTQDKKVSRKKKSSQYVFATRG